MGQYFLLILKVFQITFRRNSEKKKTFIVNKNKTNGCGRKMLHCKFVVIIIIFCMETKKQCWFLKNVTDFKAKSMIIGHTL